MMYMYLIGDGAFGISTHIMKPHPGNHDRGTSQKKNFNNWLYSSRPIFENIFGVLAAVFRIFKQPMELQSRKAAIVTMSCILLHNCLRRREASTNYKASTL